MANNAGSVKCAFCEAADINDYNEYSCLVPMRNAFGINNGIGKFESVKHAILYANKAYKDFVFVCLDEYTTRQGETVPCIVMAEIGNHDHEYLYDNELFDMF